MQLDVADFLAHYWQRKPLLIKQALPNFVSPIDGDDLAGLACEPVCLSRLILHTAKTDQWTVETGPFADDRFASLPETDWTLLVQDVDKMIDPVGALLEHFRFLPSWRIDDIMVSYAAPNGSVGAHVDDYDVFLLQAHGQRRWEISTDPSADLSFKPNVELKLLQHFEPTHSWVLDPGDILYLPPGVPHHGVAVNGDCMTFSIGLRAPSAGELMVEFAEFVAERAAGRVRFTDPSIVPGRSPGQLDAASFSRVQALMDHACAIDDDTRERWFGQFITRYRLNVEPTPRPRAIKPQAFIERLRAGKQLSRNPFSRMAWRGTAQQRAELYICGECYSTSVAVAQQLADHRSAGLAQLQAAIAEPESLALLVNLFNAGHFEWT
jgi:50S ribosomal protein L16 3-hydroxylase